MRGRGPYLGGVAPPLVVFCLNANDQSLSTGIILAITWSHEAQCFNIANSGRRFLSKTHFTTRLWRNEIKVSRSLDESGASILIPPLVEL